MATRETWKKRVEAWKASALSEEDFASGRGFGGSALRAAAQRLRAEPEVRLARVEIVAERIPSEVPVVVRTGGLRIELTRGFSREALESALDEAIGDRRGRSAVGEELPPVLEGQVAGPCSSSSS